MGRPMTASSSAFEEGTEVSLTGTLRPLGPLTAAPLSGTPCAIYVAHARVFDQLDFLGQLVGDYYAGGLVPFALDDTEVASSTPGVTIDTADFTMELGARYLEPSPDRVHAFLAARGVERYQRSTFCDEVLVMPGARITVVGVVVWEASRGGTEHGYRDAAVQLKLAGHRERPVIIGAPGRASRRRPPAAR